MPSVEKQFLLTKGPPWGFRLYLDNNGILTISKIRRHSPAETANLHSGDQIIKLNGKSTTGMSHAEAVNFIDTTIGTLNLLITRFESVSTKILTGVGKPELNNIENVKSNLNLDLKRNEASPEMPKVPACTPEVEINKEITKEVEAPKVENIVIPSSPDIQPIEISKLIKDFTDSEQPYTYVPKKRQFADSAFYSDPQNLYPTMEEKVAMARRVATSLTAPDNKNSKGASIFEKQRKRADKYTLKNKEDTPPNVRVNETQNYDLEHWPQILEPREKSPSPMYKLGYSTKQPAPPPPPPPPPPNEAKSIQEFMEKVQKFPKTKHNEITPQACFDIAAALHSSNSRGAQIFAQKKNRSKKWELSTPEPAQPQPVMVSNKGPWNDGNNRNSFPQQNKPTPRVISVVRSNSTNINKGENSTVNENAGVQTRKPTHVIRRNSNQGYQEPIKMNNPITISTSSKNVPQPQPKETTQLPTTNQWKPVKFNIPQKA